MLDFGLLEPLIPSGRLITVPVCLTPGGGLSGPVLLTGCLTKTDPRPESGRKTKIQKSDKGDSVTVSCLDRLKHGVNLVLLDQMSEKTAGQTQEVFTSEPCSDSTEVQWR